MRASRSSARLPIRENDVAYAGIGELAYVLPGAIVPPKRGRASRLGFAVDLAWVTPKMQVRAPCRQRIGAGEKVLISTSRSTLRKVYAFWEAR
jgi:hypothetical protein